MQRRDVLKLGASAALVTALARPTRAKEPTMKSRPLMNVHLSTAPIQNIGALAIGALAIYPITGGTFEGPHLRGKVLPGGDDWTLLRSDGVMELDLRVTLETDDGALIYMTFSGMRHGDGAALYFRTVPRFETAAPKYAFLNRVIAIGVGEATANGPVHAIEEIV